MRLFHLGLLAFLTTLPGCDLIGLLPNRTTVRMVNNSDFDVEIVIFIDDEQDLPESVLTEVGTELRFTVAPGETASFSRDCDQLQAIIVDDADLSVVGEVGPDTSTDVLRDGSDFGCGDTITLTFDHSALVIDFAVSVSVESRP